MFDNYSEAKLNSAARENSTDRENSAAREKRLAKGERRYLCIDLKSFYASVECAERGLDPMTTNLVVADPERSEKTICLAVSPSMKALGVKNRCRVFEIPKGIDYIMAEPRMQKYIDYSAEIYGVYLKYFSKDDIHVYSIDEAFIDVTNYLGTYNMTARELAVKVMNEIYEKVHVRATCGIGTNLYLTKIALDITAKHSPDFIGFLTEDLYRETLWRHTPITDFWRVGPGIAARLASAGIYTMEQIAKADEDMLYKKFGVDAELLIDHAWGREPVTIADIKHYKPKTNSLSNGQVLARDYSFEEARLVVKEMVEQLCLDMSGKGLVCSSMSLYLGYSNKLHATPARGTAAFTDTNLVADIMPGMMAVFDRVVDNDKGIRRMSISCNNVTKESQETQLNFFDSRPESEIQKDRDIQKAMLDIKNKYGKNGVFRGMDLQEAATTRQRNDQIGGHKRGK